MTIDQKALEAAEAIYTAIHQHPYNYPDLPRDIITAYNNDPTRKAAMETIENRLLMLQVATCSCNTKTHELKYHDERCNFRMATEAWDAILTLTGTGE